MISLSRIIEDFKKGENIDAYLTTIAGGIALILNLFGLISQEKVLTLTLAVLALISFYNIGNRYRMTDILSIISSKKEISQKFPQSFASDIEKGNELWLIGIHHSSFMSENYSFLKTMLTHGGKLNVMVASPEGAAIHMTSMRFPGNANPDQEKMRTLENLKVFQELYDDFPDHVEIKTLDYLFEYSVAFVNPNAPDGKAYCQRYTFKTMGGARKPKLMYDAANGEWYNLIRSEMNAFWTCGQNWHA